MPADTALLVIVAPRTPFKPEEIAQAPGFSDRGGPVLLLVGSPERSGLGRFPPVVRRRDRQGEIVDPLLNSPGSARSWSSCRSGPDHTTRSSIPWSTAASWCPSGSLADPLRRVGHADQAVAGRDPDPPESRATPGPRPTRKVDRGPREGPARTADRRRRGRPTAPNPGRSKEGKPRLVLVSSGSLADNVLLEIEPTNLDFLMNAVGWLRGRPELSGITPKSIRPLTLTADPILRFRLIMVPTVIAILLILGLGVTTYAARRE